MFTFNIFFYKIYETNKTLLSETHIEDPWVVKKSMANVGCALSNRSCLLQGWEKTFIILTVLPIGPGSTYALASTVMADFGKWGPAIVHPSSGTAVSPAL